MKLLNSHWLLLQDLHSWFSVQASISTGHPTIDAKQKYKFFDSVWFVLGYRVTRCCRTLPLKFKVTVINDEHRPNTVTV